MEQKLEQILLAQNWGKFSFELKKVEDQNLLGALIDLNTWKIYIEYDDGLEKIDELLAKYDNNPVFGISLPKKRNHFSGKDNLSNMLYFAVSHEIGHWKYCPAHIDDREEIYSGIAKGLKSAGLCAEETEAHNQRMFNYFVDIIDNVSNMYRDKQKEKYRDGFMGFYAKEGLLGEGFTDDFYLFVDINSKMGINDPKLKDFAKGFCANCRTLDSISQKIIRMLVEDEALADKLLTQELTIEEQVRVYQAINDRSGWHDKAIEFAKTMAPYIKNQKTYKNKTSGIREDGKPNEKEQRKMIRKSVEKGHSTGYAGKTTVLDELYRMRAEEIFIKMMQPQEDGVQLPIGYVSRKELDGTFFNINNIDWQNPQPTIDQDGNDDIAFFEKQTPILYRSQGFEKGGRIPDILFIVDKSPSTTGGYNPKKGTGPYDMVLRSIYSILKVLGETDQIQHMRFGTILFSGKPNYFTGWKGYQSMDDVKEAMLDPSNAKFGGSGFGTELEKRVVERAADENSGKRFWAIIVSDGAIGNMDEAKQAVTYLKEKGNYVTFLDVSPSGNSIFGKTFSEYVTQAGGSVFDVSEPEKLPGLVLKETKEIFG